MSQRFVFTPTAMSGLFVIQRLPLQDSRGSFERVFCAESFAPLGLEKPIVQINRSISRQPGTVRGLHYQEPPFAEVKMVSCLQGEVYDVAVDIRTDSPTFLQWHGESLSAENGKSLFIPEGFAHGFQTKTADCELLYFHSEAYVPEAEGGLHPLDPSLQIDWPLTITEMSDRDQQREYLNASSYMGGQI